MNVIDFIRESAAFMAKDRPDVYTPELAVRELTQAIEVLRESELPVGCVMFTSYLLNRTMDDGVEEFLLTRKLSSVLLCEEEYSCLVFGFSDEVQLPSIHDVQPEDDYFEEGLDDDPETW